MNVNELKDFKDFVMALQIIKGFCVRTGNCDFCPFNLIGDYGDYCMFAGDDLCGGCTPEDWDLSKLEENGGLNNGR